MLIPAAVRSTALVLLAVLALGTAAPARAGGGSVAAVVRDPAGAPVADAVVSAAVLSGPRPALRPGRAIIDQQDKEFVPRVKAILVGTEVFFPNKDNIRHHVYSFSPAKKFELPLYKGTPAAPVRFDRPGVVVLGCNIHDWMLGYVYVLETPYFGVSGADGAVRIGALPAGAYEVRVWHPRMPEAGEATRRVVTIADGPAEPVEFRIALRPEWRPRRAPAGAPEPYH